MTQRKSFRVCEKCGKRIIERLPNGLFVFEFGRKSKTEGGFEEYAPVEIQIHGSVRIKCLSRLCNHWNIFHYFPTAFGRESKPFPRGQSPEAKDNQQIAEQSTRAAIS
jgi:hypothetical protein